MGKSNSNSSSTKHKDKKDKGKKKSSTRSKKEKEKKIKLSDRRSSSRKSRDSKGESKQRQRSESSDEEEDEDDSMTSTSHSSDSEGDTGSTSSSESSSSSSGNSEVSSDELNEEAAKLARRKEKRRKKSKKPVLSRDKSKIKPKSRLVTLLADKPRDATGPHTGASKISAAVVNSVGSHTVIMPILAPNNDNQKFSFRAICPTRTTAPPPTLQEIRERTTIAEEDAFLLSISLTISGSPHDAQTSTKLYNHFIKLRERQEKELKRKFGSGRKDLAFIASLMLREAVERSASTKTHNDGTTSTNYLSVQTLNRYLRKFEIVLDCEMSSRKIKKEADAFWRSMNEIVLKLQHEFNLQNDTLGDDGPLAEDEMRLFLDDADSDFEYELESGDLEALGLTSSTTFAKQADRPGELWKAKTSVIGLKPQAVDITDPKKFRKHTN